MTAQTRAGESVETVLDVLLAQHARIEELFIEVRQAAGDRKREVFEELLRLLAVHETAEEEVVHPVARRTIDGGDAVVDDRLREERDAKEQLAALEELGTGSPDFDTKLLALRDAVLTHAKYEERYEFPHLRHHCDDSQLRWLGKAVKAAEALAPTRPHPGAESATANILAGPFAAVVDRARDAIRSATKRQ